MSSQRESMFCTEPLRITTNSLSGSSRNAEAPITRKCNVCGEVKFAVDLVASKRYVHGYMPLCKPCRNDYWQKRRANVPGERRRAIDTVRKSRLLRVYGLTAADYERMLAEQGNKCKLCGAENHGRGSRFRFWNIDHSHKTGAVRGLLCHMCNITIGKYENLVEKVGAKAIANYIKEK